MAQSINRLATRFDRLSPRERGIITLALFMVPLMVIYSMWIDPSWNASRNLNRQLQLSQTQYKAMQQQLMQTRGVLATDPNQQIRQQITQREVQIKEIDDALDKEASHLVPPTKMVGIIENLIKALPQIRLEKLHTVAAQEIVLPNQTANLKSDRRLYQHSVDMVLRGNYLDVLFYLEKLEALPKRSFWENLKMETPKEKDEPLRFTVRLYTLSSEQDALVL